MKTLEDYTTDIIQYHNAIKLDSKNADEYQLKLNTRLGEWQKRLDITILIDNREQLPWTESELNIKTRPAFTKKESGFQSIGDYQFFVYGLSGIKYGGFLVERKTCGDLYGSLFNMNKETQRKSRDRFYAEIERFSKDNRFQVFYVFVESTLHEWLNYKPPNSKNPNNLMINEKLGVIGSIESRGGHIIWAGNRSTAMRLYRDFVRQWCIKNYDKILNLK